MTDKKKLAAMDDRTVPVPVPATSAPVEQEPTENRAPQDQEPPREGSAVHPAPVVVPRAAPDEDTVSFDEEVEKDRAPPARPARGHTAVRPAPLPQDIALEPTQAVPPSTSTRPAEVFTSEPARLPSWELAPPAPNDQATQPPPPAEPTQAVLPGRPREPQPVGLLLAQPTITAPLPVQAERASTQPTGVAVHSTTEEGEAPPVGIAAPTAPLIPGTPTLELPASDVDPDDPTRLKVDRPPPRRRGSMVMVLAALAVAGVVGGLGVARALGGRGPAEAAATTPPAAPTTAAPTTTADPVATPAAAVPPAPPTVAERPHAPPSPPPAALAPPEDTAPPEVEPAPALHAAPAIAPPPPEPTPGTVAPPKPQRTADGFGPFVDLSGAGLGGALGDGVRRALGDALAGTAVGVRGEVRRAQDKAGSATADCAMLIFDEGGPRATVRGAARVDDGAATREQRLRRAAKRCAGSLEQELRAAVAHARAGR